MTDPEAILRGFHALKREQHRTPDSDREPSAEVLVFGTADACDIRVSDPYASPRHCRAWRDADGYWIEDLGSTNGTWIQRGGVGPAERVYGSTRVRPGDTIRIGRTALPWSAVDA